MRAIVNDTVLAEAAESELVRIEGNWYFPPSAVAPGVLTESTTAYTCPWKGPAQYWDVVTPSGTTEDGAWSYPRLFPTAVQRVGTDFAGWVAFSPGITVDA